MKRLLALMTMAVAGTVLMAVVVVGYRLSQGEFNYSAYAHPWDHFPCVLGNPVLSIDMEQDTDGSWCSPVNSVAETMVGSDYQVAVCLSCAPAAPAEFSFELTYDDSLSECVPAPADPTALDSNPDANEGVTTFSIPDLGSDWDCDLDDSDPPSCDKDADIGPAQGRAYLHCKSVAAPTLSHGTNVVAPLAVVSLRTTAGGLDALSFASGEILDEFGSSFLDCSHSAGCYMANNIIVTPIPTYTPVPPTPTFTPTSTHTPSPTPTATRTPAPTGTPRPPSVGGSILLPPAAIADGISMPDGDAGPSLLAWATLAGGLSAAIAVFFAACYIGRRRVP